jgi:hypothetical protein
MRRPRTASLVMFAVLALAAGTPSSGHAADKNRSTGDRVWEAPDLARYPVRSIALLPPASYDGSVENRKLVETAIGQTLRGSGHRWASPFLVRDQLLKAGGDSLVKALAEKLLKNPRLDSLDAPYLSRTLRTRGILTVRIDQMERRELEPGQSGRPTTTVQLHGALVDSTGRLLWTVSSNETMEGAQQDGQANVIGVKASGLNNTAVGGTSPAPLFQEVLLRVFKRWAEHFPGPPPADSTGTSN